MNKLKQLYCSQILLASGWADKVLIEIDSVGNIVRILTDQCFSEGMESISGVVIPGIANCHSHAHQRAMSGLGERAKLDLKTGRKSKDSFWTWRETMYQYLACIQPDHLYHIARQLYLEMLKSGYSHVAEFQYLHHDQSGNHYANKAEMTLQCMQAANDVGIGFTALPVLYKFSGFGEQSAIAGQKRFLNNKCSFVEIVHSVQSHIDKYNLHQCNVGIAPHSLRAISAELLNEVIDDLGIDRLAAVHIHIAEQTQEVIDCLAFCGARPVQWMMDQFNVDQKWCAIHATHMEPNEIEALARSGAVAGLCPTTEANLGDGFFSLMQYQALDGHWAIGSDSHISVSPIEELRWLEYGQRLLFRRRNVMANESELHTGMALLQSAWAGGAQACGENIGKIAEGSRADFLVLDDQQPRLYGREKSSLVDSLIFSGNENLVKDVYVAGQKVIAMARHADEEEITSNYQKTLDELVEVSR